MYNLEIDFEKLWKWRHSLAKAWDGLGRLSDPPYYNDNFGVHQRITSLEKQKEWSREAKDLIQSVIKDMREEMKEETRPDTPAWEVIA